MRFYALFFCLLGFLPALSADSLSAIMARMNRDAPNFHALTADLVMDTYQKILDAHTKESGSLKMQRSSKGEVRALIDFTGNSARTLFFAGRNVRIYYPAINQYQDVSLGSNAGVVNQYLLLGFGSSGDQLAQSYTITEEGQENVSGVLTTKLLLVPRDQAVLEHLVKVELWIPENESNPVQQQFYEPSGNFRLINYSNTTINPAIAGTLQFKLPKDAHRQR